MIKGFVAALMVVPFVGCASLDLGTILNPFMSVVEIILEACGDVPLDELKECLRTELVASGDTDITLDELSEAAEAARAEEAAE